MEMMVLTWHSWKSPLKPPASYKWRLMMIKKVLTSLLKNKKVANATHNIFAYRIMQQQSSHSIVLQGCEDDGETHAGSRMLHLLQILDAQNVMVVVSRWYGGIHLGADRFKHINNCTRTILETCGYVKDKILDAQNVMVVVSRWYGGIHLGADRFKNINNCTRTILETCGYVKDKEDKQGPKSVHEKKKR